MLYYGFVLFVLKWFTLFLGFVFFRGNTIAFSQAKLRVVVYQILTKTLVMHIVGRGKNFPPKIGLIILSRLKSVPYHY